MICLIELVDFNEDRVKESKTTTSGKRTRRSRTKKTDDANIEAPKQSKEDAVVEAQQTAEPVVDATIETTDDTEPKA